MAFTFLLLNNLRANAAVESPYIQMTTPMNGKFLYIKEFVKKTINKIIYDEKLISCFFKQVLYLVREKV